MKKTILLLAILVGGAFTVAAKDVKGIEIVKTDGETMHIANTEIKSMTFSGGDAVLTSVNDSVVNVPRNMIVSVSSVAAVATEYTVKYEPTV